VQRHYGAGAEEKKRRGGEREKGRRGEGEKGRRGEGEIGFNQAVGQPSLKLRLTKQLAITGGCGLASSAFAKASSDAARPRALLGVPATTNYSRSGGCLRRAPREAPATLK